MILVKLIGILELAEEHLFGPEIDLVEKSIETEVSCESETDLDEFDLSEVDPWGIAEISEVDDCVGPDTFKVLMLAEDEDWVPLEVDAVVEALSVVFCKNFRLNRSSKLSIAISGSLHLDSWQ